MSKVDYIRKAITDFPHNEFTIPQILHFVRDKGVGKHYLQSFMCKAVKRGEIRKLTITGKGIARQVTYTKKPLVKEKVAVQQELPLELPMEKLGEMVFASWQLLKQQINELETKLEHARTQYHLARKGNQELKKQLQDKEAELKTITEALRNKTGKTFSMSEVARVIRNGRLITPESPGAV